MNRLMIAAALLGAWSVAAHASPTDNGTYVNGTYVNGTYVNGTYVNGTYVNTALINGGTVGGTSVAGMTRYGQPVQYVGVYRSELTGWTLEYSWWFGFYYWAAHSDAWFVGAQLNGTLINPTTHVQNVVPLRIDGFARAPAPNDDVTTYVVSAQLQTLSPQGILVPYWTPLCGLDGQHQPVPVIPLTGAWDYSRGTYYGGAKVTAEGVSFACLNASLGKCAAKLGYKPWQTRWMYLCDSNGGNCGWTYDDLQDFHQTCSRMVTDDFCGDGRSYTATGTHIDVWDVLGINVFDHAEPWKFEAAWTPTGAQWLVCERLAPFDNTCPSYIDPAGGPVKHQMPSRACLITLPGGVPEEPSLSLTGALIGNRSLGPWGSFTPLPLPPALF